jgi:chromosome segregation protein
MARTRGWSRLVTLDGEVIHASGAVTGGVQSRAPYGIVQRRADLAALEEELADVISHRAKLGTVLDRLAANMTDLDHTLRTLRGQRQSVQQEVDDKRRFWRNLADELKSTEAAAARLERELAQLQVTNEAAEEIDIAEMETERDQLAAALLATVNEGGASTARLEEANARLQRAHTNVAAISKRLTLARDEAESRSDRLKNLGPLRDRISQERAAHQSEQEQAEFRQTDLTQQLAAATGVRQSLLERSFAAAESAKAARRDASLVDQGLSQSEIAKARAETKRAATLERLLEEYGLTGDDAEMLAPNTVIPDDAVSLTQRLRRDLKSMGEVNLGAIEAYQRLTERFEELDAQRADVEEGIAQVQATISELDALTREKFLTAFEAVRTAFADVYLSIMGGGAGELRLSDAQNVLESGIEIDITLPGKNRQPLMLLSGGERSLCATAFLFSLLKVKPSPLVILDEVDAPLDGRNVERFAALLQRFTEQTQFIVITHNPTTIEAAPVWLGVTMQEPGVSSLVPARAKPNSQMPDES